MFQFSRQSEPPCLCGRKWRGSAAGNVCRILSLSRKGRLNAAVSSCRLPNCFCPKAIVCYCAVKAAAQLLSRRDLLRIAQRFNVGWGSPYDLVFSPEGTVESRHRVSTVSGNSQPSLSGLGVFVVPDPTVKRWAIFGGPSGTENPGQLAKAAFSGPCRDLGFGVRMFRFRSASVAQDGKKIIFLLSGREDHNLRTWQEVGGVVSRRRPQ